MGADQTIVNAIITWAPWVLTTIATIAAAWVNTKLEAMRNEYSTTLTALHGDIKERKECTRHLESAMLKIRDELDAWKLLSTSAHERLGAATAASQASIEVLGKAVRDQAMDLKQAMPKLEVMEARLVNIERMLEKIIDGRKP